MSDSIFIADDHPLILMGLENFLLEKNYNVIGKEINGRSALNFILKHRPCIAVLDYEMPKLDGIEIARECLKEKIKTKIILITFHKGVSYYLNAKNLNNIYGYLLKEFALEELENCLESVKKNKRYFSQEIKNLLIFKEESLTNFNKLTATEIKVLRLVASFKSNKEISEILFVSYRTVEKYRRDIIAKLELPKKAGSLLIWALEKKHVLFK